MSDLAIIVETITGMKVPLASDWGVQAQQAAEDHMTRVWAFFHAAEEGTETGDDPAIGAFDGCQTCEVRETLYAALPFIEAGLLRDAKTYQTPPPPLQVNLVRCPQEEEVDPTQDYFCPEPVATLATGDGVACGRLVSAPGMSCGGHDGDA